MRNRKVLALPLIIAVLLAGCAAQDYKVKYPGALDQLDGKAYEVLGVAQATLDAAKAEQKAGTLPATAIPVINRAGAAYNVARDAWLIYREQVKAGKDSTASAAALTNNLNLVNDAILQVRKAIGGK